MNAPKVKAKCKVRGGKFVEPCTALNDALEPIGVRSKGLRYINLSNLTTGKATRSFPVLHSGEYAKRGIVLNYCPFCGTRIDAPFHEPTAATSGTGFLPPQLQGLGK